MAERKFDTRMVEQKVAGGVAKVKQMMGEAEGNVKDAMKGLRHHRVTSNRIRKRRRFDGRDMKANICGLGLYIDLMERLSRAK
jgi:hypothetical protein